MRVVVLLIVAASLVPSAQGFDVVGPSWTAARVATSCSGMLVVDAATIDGPGPTAVGAAIYDGAGVLVDRITWLSSRSREGVQVQAYGRHLGAMGPGPGSGGSFVHLPVETGPGSHIAVVWAAGDIASWSSSVDGDCVTIGAITQGPDAFLFAADTFDGAAAHVRPVGLGGRAQAGTSLDLVVGGALQGHFTTVSALPTGATVDRLAFTRDGGPSTPCACDFDAAPAGGYRFDVTGAGLGAEASSGVVLMGADVTFPPP